MLNQINARKGTEKEDIMKVKFYTDGNSDLVTTDKHVGILNGCMGTGAAEGEGYCSHISMFRTDEYLHETNIDLSQVRRQLEDRLRKDGQLLKKLLFTAAWIEDHKGIRDGFLESQLEKI